MRRIYKIWQNTTIARWYYGLQASEARLVQCAVVLFVVVFAYLGLWQPAETFRDFEVRKLQNEVAGLDWMRANEANVRNRVADISSTSDINLANVSNTAQRFQVPLVRIQSVPSGGISIQIEGQRFNNLLRLLDALQQEYGMRVTAVSIDKSGEGLVNARISLI